VISSSRVRLEGLAAVNKCLAGKVVPECLVDRWVLQLWVWFCIVVVGGL